MCLFLSVAVVSCVWVVGASWISRVACMVVCSRTCGRLESLLARPRCSLRSLPCTHLPVSRFLCCLMAAVPLLAATRHLAPATLSSARLGWDSLLARQNPVSSVTVRHRVSIGMARNDHLIEHCSWVWTQACPSPSEGHCRWESTVVDAQPLMFVSTALCSRWSRPRLKRA